MVAPANGFYSNPLLGKNEIRLAYVIDSEQIIKAMRCLKEALAIYNN